MGNHVHACYLIIFAKKDEKKHKKDSQLNNDDITGTCSKARVTSDELKLHEAFPPKLLSHLTSLREL